MAFLCQRAIQPIAARPGFIDKDEVLAFECSLRMSLSRSHWRVPMVPRETTSASMVLGHVGDCDRLFMDIQADIKHARLGHG